MHIASNVAASPLVWLLAGLGFVIAGVATFRDSPAWPSLSLFVTLFSLGLTVMGWAEAKIGLVLNVVLLVYVLVGPGAGWLARGRNS